METMTRNEALKQLKLELSRWESDCKSYHKTKDALKYAIKELEQEGYYKCLAQSYERTIVKLTEAIAKQHSDDCVSRQAVLEKINDWWGIISTSGEPTLCDYIRELPPATPTQRWIPCSERLPKAGEYVDDVAKYYLVQNEYGDMLVARYTHSKYWEQIYRMEPIGDEIVAWMPLPKPYKAEMEGEEDGND